MNREQYIQNLSFWHQAETAGALAGEVAMLLRSDPKERAKLDLFRRVEACCKLLCRAALKREGIALPTVATSFYRNGYKLGHRFAEGDWSSFLDRFEATVHPEEFANWVTDSTGQGISHEYDGVDKQLLEHLARHEAALARFVALEREGREDESTEELERILQADTCQGLIEPDDPVGW